MLQRVAVGVDAISVDRVARSRRSCRRPVGGPQDEKRSLRPADRNGGFVCYFDAGRGGSGFGRVASALYHRDIDAPDLSLGADLNRLLVAVGAQCQVGGKAVSLDKYVDLATARGALQIAENVAARFAPVAGDPFTLAGNIAAQVEFVAVAGAVQILLQVQSGAVDLVVGLATDAFGGSVGQRNRAGAGPCSVKTGKRAARLRVARGQRQYERGANGNRLDGLSKQARNEQFHMVFSRLN
jgi:hypothetical protein